MPPSTAPRALRVTARATEASQLIMRICADGALGSAVAGDLMRRFAFGRNGMSASFLSCNRNKRSLAIDMKSGRMSRMGIVPEISGGLRSSIENPRLYDQFCTLDAIRRQGR